jgi:DnaJ-class molecular chaperone
MQFNPYKTLGVSRGATPREIKVAYYRLAQEYHPDKTKGDQSLAEKAKEINSAYEILSNPAKRAEYDRTQSEKPITNIKDIVRQSVDEFLLETTGRKFTDD